MDPRKPLYSSGYSLEIVAALLGCGGPHANEEELHGLRLEYLASPRQDANTLCDTDR